MKIAIMQPYFMPYIGYFQLLNAVDKFVILDDVNFINRGWINRNNILINGKPGLITIPLIEASQNKKIIDISIVQDANWKNKILKTIELSYKKAPFFNQVFSWLNESIALNISNISKFNVAQIKAVCNYLGINTSLVESSTIYNLSNHKGEEKIIEICLKEKAETYINPIGGLDLYNKQNFKEKNISLNFIKANDIRYKQYFNDFIPCLSMIDILMFNEVAEIKSYLDQYSLQ